MNSPRVGLRVAALFFGLVCLGHAWRLFAHLEVRIGSYDIPTWPSMVAVFVTGALGLWFWRLSASRDEA
ncbi:MAG TPA: hypothetical protein VGG94_07665 [Chthoniobacterales bacterium]|jgi:hypothetical protein